MPQATDRVVNLSGGLKIYVLGPTLDQAKALQVEWDKDVKKRPNLGLKRRRSRPVCREPVEHCRVSGTYYRIHDASYATHR